jgi:hypothetical protein
MPSDTIAIVPNMGYQLPRRYSAKGCRWLSSLDSNIHHAGNGGEVTLRPYTVDGHDEESRTVYEFYGSTGTAVPGNASPSRPENLSRFIRDPAKSQSFRRSRLYNYQYLGARIRSPRPQLHQFIENLDIQDPLNPQDALYGGRTNATRLYCEEGDMRYVDVCSLYPFVLKYKPFPIGHPQIVIRDFGDVNQYFGLTRCRVFPPRALYHSVFPYKTGGKLLFSLCRTRAELRDLGPDDRCQHTDSQRSLTGTWVTSELQKVLQLGYQLDLIYEVWNFPREQPRFICFLHQYLPEN